MDILLYRKLFLSRNLICLSAFLNFVFFLPILAKDKKAQLFSASFLRTDELGIAVSSSFVDTNLRGLGKTENRTFPPRVDCIEEQKQRKFSSTHFGVAALPESRNFLFPCLPRRGIATNCGLPSPSSVFNDPVFLDGRARSNVRFGFSCGKRRS